MNGLIVTAIILMMIVLLLETFVTLIAVRANNEAYDRYIAEIKHSQELEKIIKEKERQYDDLAQIIKEVSEEMKQDGEKYFRS